MLGELQKQKLTKLFRIWDTDSNGFLELDDWVRLAHRRAELSGIGPETPEYQNLRSLFTGVWEKLRESADTNRDERVSLDEFVSFCDKQYGAVRGVSFEALPEQIRGILGAIILSVDRDHDGRISADDYYIFLSTWVGEISAEAKAAFKRNDRDGDGHITVEEARELVAQFTLSNDPAAPGNSLFG